MRAVHFGGLHRGGTAIAASLGYCSCRTVARLIEPRRPVVTPRGNYLPSDGVILNMVSRTIARVDDSRHHGERDDRDAGQPNDHVDAVV